MKIILYATLLAALIFLIIDIIWLSFSVKSFYGPRIGHLFADKPVIWAAAMFYIIYVVGLAVVIIEPSINFDYAYIWPEGRELSALAKEFILEISNISKKISK